MVIYRECRLFTLALALMACSGKSESSPQAAGQAPVAGGSAGAAGSPAAGGTAPSGVGGLNIVGEAGEPGVVVGGTSTGGPCGGGAAPPTGGNGVIGGTWGNAGSDGEAGAPDTIYLDCSAYQRCGVGRPACAGTSACYSIGGCNTAICAHDLCEACPGECFYLDSYPGQIECDGASYRGVESEVDAIVICN